jgi:predicted transposase/invertase (TIGR01784 family)
MPYIPTWERRAKKEGKIEAKEEMAQELLKRGVPLDIVAQSSGLSPEKLEKLIDKEK